MKCKKNCLKTILICVGAAVAVGAAVFFLVKMLRRYCLLKDTRYDNPDLMDAEEETPDRLEIDHAKENDDSEDPSQG